MKSKLELTIPLACGCELKHRVVNDVVIKNLSDADNVLDYQYGILKFWAETNINKHECKISKSDYIDRAEKIQQLALCPETDILDIARELAELDGKKLFNLK